jgi:beta-galactosidase
MRFVVTSLLLLVIAPGVGAQDRPRIDLNGTWTFRTDPADEGEAAGWHTGELSGRTIEVPGAWQAQGVGEPRGALRHDYAGAAWYRRVVPVPASWQGKVVRLKIGGAHRTTTVFVNGQRIGVHEGFSAPFSFDVSAAVRPDADNVLALRIENPGQVPQEGPREQKPDQPTGMLNYIGNWGGIYGNVSLEAVDPVSIEHAYIRPDVDAGVARFEVSVSNRETVARTTEVRVAVGGRTVRAALRVEAGARGEASLIVPMPGARLWSPEHPHLYDAVISVHEGRRERDRVPERFGMRQVRTSGNVLLLNGVPLYLRGYGDDNIEVLTGFPPASREVYRERLRQARAFGFNAVRFHSMTPPEEFFHAADEVGLFVMAELPAAYTQYVLPHRTFLRQELEGVLRAYRNRPSLLSLAFGNEFNLSWLETEAEKTLFLETVADFYAFAKSLHPDGLVLSNDGYVMRPTDMVSHYGGGLPDFPVVKHEFGEYYCSLPDISLLARFTGVLIPEWLHVKQRWVSEQGLTAEYPAYVRNSQRLQQLGRKYQIERVRHRQDITGYHYWLIVDFPGGTGEGDSWEEGWFDYFWQPKGIEAREGQAINGAVVPLIGTSVRDRTLWSDGARTVDVFVSNYGERPLDGAELTWTVAAGGVSIASGSEKVSLPTGKVERVAQVVLRGSAIDRAQKLDLTVAVDGQHENAWSFWSFPKGALVDRTEVPVHSTVKWAGINRLYPFVQEGVPPADSRGLLVTSTLDAAALAHLRSGGRVWLMAERGSTQARQDVAFFPAAGGALGTMVREHPALQAFPHEGFGDLQFFNLMDGAVPVPLDTWPTSLQPIIGGIRTTAGFLSKSKNLSRVGHVFEARVGTGRLLVTSLRFREHLDEAYPEAIALFDRLLRYATGAAFAPTVEAGSDQLAGLMPPG